MKPIPNDGDNYIYHVILNFLEPVTRASPVVFSIIAFLLVFTQATLLNRICNTVKLYPKPNYLVGMSYMMVTSLMKEWSYFSAPLIVNSLLIWIYYRVIVLY